MAPCQHITYTYFFYIAQDNVWRKQTEMIITSDIVDIQVPIYYKQISAYREIVKGNIQKPGQQYFRSQRTQYDDAS